MKLNPARKIDLTKIWKRSQTTNSPSNHIISSQTLSSQVQTDTNQSSQGTTEPVIASSFPISPQTTLIAQSNITPSRNNFENQTTHQVSPNIQHRITQFLTNSRRSTYNETEVENSPLRRRNLRPRSNFINYHE